MNIKLMINTTDESLMTLPVEKMPGINHKASDALMRNGISTFGKLCDFLWEGQDVADLRTVGVKAKRVIQNAIIETVTSRKSDAELEAYAETLKKLNAYNAEEGDDGD